MSYRMPVASDQILKKLYKSCAAFFIVLMYCVPVKAQPGNLPFRILEMRNDLIYGSATVGSVVKLYEVIPGTCQRRGNAIDSVVTVAPYVFAFNGSFSGPYMVTMKTGNGEVFESSVIGADEIRITQASCGDPATVQLFPLRSGDRFTYSWKDQAGNEISDQAILTNAAPGLYTLEYQVAGGCIFRSNVISVHGKATPVSRDIALDCGESARLVRGNFTTSSGPPSGYTFLWEDNAGNSIGTTQELSLGPGSYFFSVISSSGCISDRAAVNITGSPPLASIDSRNMVRTPANCGQKNGAITGVTASIPNATYRWTSASGDVYNTKDITNIWPGVYTLEVFAPGSQCPTLLSNVEVEELNAITMSTRNYIPVQTSCGMNNGAITGIETNATSYRWLRVNADGTETEVAASLDLTDASPGYYVLELKNDINCILRSRAFHIQERGPAIGLLEPPVIKADECNLGKGSISGFRFNTQISSYTWRDASGNVFSSSPGLNNLKAGTYTVTVKTQSCEATYAYTVNNNEAAIIPPVMENMLICDASDVLLSFKETADIYRIYDAGGKLLAERNDPNFRIKVTRPGNYFAALASGTCESPRTEFRIDFGASGLTIPSAFSPNGDGENDKWIIKGIDTYTDPEIKIFNRQGNIVFHTKGRSAPFDGKSKGADLPVGVYYYVVRTSLVCPAETGSVTIIR